MASKSIIATEAGRFIKSRNGSFAIVRAGNSLSVADPTSTNPDYLLGARYDITASHFMYRSWLFFDLSDIAAGGKVPGDVNLKIWVYSKDFGDATYPNIKVVEGKQSDPVVTGDWVSQTATTTELGSVHINTGITAGQYNTITLNAAGKALVEAAFGGTLKLCLRDERDNSNKSTTAVRTHGIWYYMTQKGTGYEPTLEFTYYKAPYPSDSMARVSSIRHIFRPGFYRMQVGLGDIGLDIDVAEATVRKALDTAKEVDIKPWELPFPELPPKEPLPTIKPWELPFPEADISVPKPPEPSLWQKLTPWKEEKGETFGSEIMERIKAYTDWWRRLLK